MQVQPNARSVAGELETVFSQLLRHNIKITTAGRTDTGVHATGQVVSFKTATAFPFEKLAIAANSKLPRDVSVRDAHPAAQSFSARFSAVERTYVYAIYNAGQRNALYDRFSWHFWADVDLDRFNTAARALIGEHDFRSFCGTLPQSGPTIRTVRYLHATRVGDVIRVEVRADGFLHRMVRTVVGTLFECASGKRDSDAIPRILAARDRAAAGATAPARGLYLAGVRYDDGFDSFQEPALLASKVSS